MCNISVFWNVSVAFNHSSLPRIAKGLPVNPRSGIGAELRHGGWVHENMKSIPICVVFTKTLYTNVKNLEANEV